MDTDFKPISNVGPAGAPAAGKDDADQLLVERAQAGDGDAVGELYQRHAPAIFRYLYARVSERATAEDLTGAVFVKMVEGLPGYEARGKPFVIWLYRIAYARLVDHYRRGNVRQTEVLAETLVDHQADPEATAGRAINIQRLSGLMRRLSDDQQWVLQLRFMEGYTLEETSTVMGKATTAVKALQHRALDNLRANWDPPREPRATRSHPVVPVSG
jgi:RNA polymerase sigma-70 factor (ECF subfamily)